MNMPCELWKVKLDAYVDGELSTEDMRAFDAHVRECPSCAADALSRVQLKRALQIAGKRFTPSPEFRARMQPSLHAKPRRSRRFRSRSRAPASRRLKVASPHRN